MKIITIIMNSKIKFFKSKIDSAIDASGLSIFRILFSINLFFEVLRIYDYKELYYDKIPFLEPNSIPYISTILIVWLISLVFITAGLFTRFFCIISYFITVYFVNGNGMFEYHMNYIYVGISFLMIFMPMSNRFSVSNILFKDKSEIKVSKYNYFMLIYVGIALVYFGSIFFKIKSQAWLSGLGIWLPSSIPQIIINDFQFILNQEILVKILGYSALIFEIVFPFLFFIKRIRLVLLFIGFFMHIGILLLYPIPNFALGYLTIYTLMVPLSFWKTAESKIRTLFKLRPYKSATIYNNRLNYKMCIFVFLFFTFLQLNATFNFPLSKRIVDYVTVNKTVSPSIIESIRKTKLFLFQNSTHFLGLTGHSVFIDGHYIGFDKVFNVSYKGEFLPLYDNVGMCDEFLQAGSWANFNFIVNGPFVEKKYPALKKGLIRYVSFWAHKNNIDLNNAEFEVSLKKVRVNFEWEKDLLKENLATPWEEVGKIVWRNKVAEVILDEIKIGK